jgi:hypothetical protein
MEDSRVRPDHVHLNGRVFSFDDPPVADTRTGFRGNPGEAANCFPGDSIVKIFHGVKKAFRRWYDGELATVVLESGESFRATPNHPILTVDGWKAIGCLNEGDEVFQISKDSFPAPETDNNQGVTAIKDAFDSFALQGSRMAINGSVSQFHGDGSDGQVDVIFPARSLPIDRKPSFLKRSRDFLLSKTNCAASAIGNLGMGIVAFFLGNRLCGGMGSGGQSLSFPESHSGHAERIRFGTASHGDTGCKESVPKRDSADSGSLRDRKFALTGEICVDKRFWVELNATVRTSRERVARIFTSSFHGFVYNMETESGWYASANVIVSNCRCVPLPILSLMEESA